MFVVVTAAVILLGWATSEWRFVLKRKALAKEFSDRIGPVGYIGPYFNPEPPTIPFWRSWMGDEPCHAIDVPYGAPKSDFKRAKELFPEAEIYVSPSPDEIKRYFSPPRL
jgi:hypothetical protein